MTVIGNRPTPAASTLVLEVIAIDRSVPDVASLTLASPDRAPLPGFIPGSHIQFTTATFSNAYSLTGGGVNPCEYRISVLRVADGRGGSRWINDQLEVGETVAVSLPRSAFAPSARATKHLLVAGGIGITPILSHIRAARAWNRNIELLYTFRPGFGAHVDEVAELAGQDGKLFTDQDEFCDALDAALADQPFGTHLYTCGPAGMIERVLRSAASLGWPESRIHLERFGIDALDAGDPFQVRLSESGRTIEVDSGISMLEALENNGIEVRNRCRQGVCGECITPVSAGEPIHRDLFLTDDEKQACDALMPCVSRAAKGTTLEVPL